MRRVMRFVFSPFIVVPVILLSLITIGVLGYYYTTFSARIDGLLRGEVFTRTAGIYAAPKRIRAGDAATPDDIIARLKRAGYVERNQQAEAERGRYQLSGMTLDITPNESGIIDGAPMFPALNIKFDSTSKKIQSLTDTNEKANVKDALLEPEQISSVTGDDREKRKIIGFRDLPPHLVKAITVTEDRTFFEHHGINFRGIARAFLRRYEGDTSSPISNQGGSSITQQLVKNLLLTPEKTWSRKIAEAYMSVIIETRLSKEEIFALYANEVYLGQSAGFAINGFGRAANAYFSKNVSELTLEESAFLAGIIRSPNRYNPYKNLQNATERRNQVLDSMREANAVEAGKIAQARSTPLKVTPTRNRLDTTDAPYFIDYAQEELSETLADASAAQRLRIYTTIDMDLQRAAYKAVTKQLAALDKIYAKRVPAGTLQASLVAMNAKTGEVVAMVGGRDYEKSVFNRATDAMRQPGSVFKPFVYATALNTAFDPIPRVITAATMYEDKPKEFAFDNQTYAPGNYADAYSNKPVTLRDALVKSLNVVTVDVAMEVTIGRVMNLAAKAGLPRPQRPYPAMSLGTNEATPLQIASAYTAFANSGKRVAPIAINRITTGEGETIAAPVGQQTEVMRPEVAFIMTSFMRDVVNRGTAAKLRAHKFKHNVAGKTGTSRDGWFAGYTPELVCAVYVGFDDGSELGLKGSDSALPIWEDFMSSALAEHPEWATDWQMPTGVTQAEIDARTGGLIDPEAAAIIDVNGVVQNPVKRLELFVGNTAPIAPIVPTLDEYADETAFSEDYDATPVPDLPVIEPSSRAPVAPLNLPNPTRGRTPTLEGRGVLLPDGSTRLVGTVTVDIDPTTGLLATSSCPVSRSKTYPLGQQPTRSCSAELHGGRPRAAVPDLPRVPSVPRARNAYP